MQWKAGTDNMAYEMSLPQIDLRTVGISEPRQSLMDIAGKYAQNRNFASATASRDYDLEIAKQGNLQGARERQSLSQIAQASLNPDGSLNKRAVRDLSYQSPDISPQTAMKLDAAYSPDIKKQALVKAYETSKGNHKQFLKNIAADRELGPGDAQDVEKLWQDNQSSLEKATIYTKAHAANMFEAALVTDANGNTTVSPTRYAGAVAQMHGVLDEKDDAGNLTGDIPQPTVEDIRAYVAQNKDPELALSLRKQTEEERHNRPMEKAALITANRPLSVFQTPFSGPGGQNKIDSYVEALYRGDADPSLKDLSTRSGGSQRIDVINRMSELHPEFNFSQAVGDRTYWNNQTTKKQLQVMNVVSEQLPKLLQASAEMKRLNIPMLDKKGIEILNASGNTDAANYIGASVASVEDIAKAIAGGNAITDDQLKLAQRMVPMGATPAQLEKIAKQIAVAVDSRKATVYRQGGIYGKNAAKTDPYLDESVKQEILGGEAPAAQSQSKSVNGVTYIKQADGLWHKQ